MLIAGAHASPWVSLAAAGQTGSVIADTSAGKVRGVVAEDIKIFKGIPYGGTTAGKNRFMPPTKPQPGPGRGTPSTMDPARRKAAGMARRDLQPRARTAWC